MGETNDVSDEHVSVDVLMLIGAMVALGGVTGTSLGVLGITDLGLSFAGAYLYGLAGSLILAVTIPFVYGWWARSSESLPGAGDPE